MKTKTRATKKQTVKPKAGAAKKSKRNGKSKSKQGRKCVKTVPKIRMTRKLTFECNRKPSATPRATTQPKNVSGKAKSYAKKETNCTGVKRKLTTCIKTSKSNKLKQNCSQTYLDFLREYKIRNGMVPEQEAVQRAAIAYCVLSENLRRRYLRQAKLRKEGLL
ncbi:hypothetical protein AWZ03_013356 [Drosophila navojoa]|uniref:Uncharacterized protein n=1 Tax=Drosophila navojoa TaxID=7232 RepID=A0A484AW36_DRONA|nr:hypothetical protein AWZ03_013356 [Drosophila navojoa]